MRTISITYKDTGRRQNPQGCRCGVIRPAIDPLSIGLLRCLLSNATGRLVGEACGDFALPALLGILKVRGRIHEHFKRGRQAAHVSGRSHDDGVRTIEKLPSAGRLFRGDELHARDASSPSQGKGGSDCWPPQNGFYTLRSFEEASYAIWICSSGISTLPEITTTTAIHKTGKLMKLPISVKALYGEDQRIISVEATFYPSRDEV
jgi:hypothetical protein